MILAAGRGDRLRPLTDTLPKPLHTVRGKPLIVWLIEALAGAGIGELVINHAHLGEMLVSALGDGARLGVRIRYSAEAQALETAGGIAHALPLLGDEPFIAVNADVLCNYDFSRLAARRLRADLAHLVLVPNPAHHPEGDFALAGERVAARGEATRMHTFAGIGLYSPALFRDLAPGRKAPLAPLLRSAMDEERVGGELHRGMWHDVGTPERLAALNAAA